MSQVLLEREVEDGFGWPYGPEFGMGDCAESTGMKNVDKSSYADKVTMMLAGSLLVRHAP